MRINQFVARATGLSRRAADEAIIAHRVQINGLTAFIGTDTTTQDEVRLDGARIKLPTHFTYIALNKPAGFVTSRAQQGKSPTLYELLPQPFHKLRPAGRLDRDSSGLLLLSDDGDFLQALTHPSAGKVKRYELTLSKPVTQEHLSKVAAGISLDDGISHVTIIESNGPHVIVELTEGRNRQLRRTFGALGYDIPILRRTHIGPYSIGTLKPGQYRAISPERQK